MSVTRARSRVALEAKAAKNNPEPSSHARLSDARRDLAEAKLAACIQRVVDDAPVPLSPEQRDRLAVLLRSGGAQQ